jgi:hypothetical protein
MKKTQPANRPRHNHHAFGRVKHKQQMHYDRIPRRTNSEVLPTYCVIDLQNGEVMSRNNVRHAIGTSINLGKVRGEFRRYLACYSTRDVFVCL